MTERDIEILRRMRRKLDNIRGPGVVNTPDGVLIRWPRTDRRRGDDGEADALEPIFVRVTGSTRDGSNWRWTYQFVEVHKTAAGYGGWTNKPDGQSGTMYNLIEDQNGASGVMGSGVDTNNLVGTFEPKPIPNNTRLLAWPVKFDETTEWWCQYENGVDGECPQ